MTHAPIRRGHAVTLIEAVLFIAVALGVIVGGLVFYQQASVARQTQETVRFVTALVAEGQGLFRNQRVPGGRTDITAALIASGSVPASYVESSNTLKSPWDASVYVIGNSEPYTGIVTFGITMDHVPPKVCMRLATFDSNGSGVMGQEISEIHIYDVVTPPRTPVCTIDRPGTMAKAKACCIDAPGEIASMETVLIWRN